MTILIHVKFVIFNIRLLKYILKAIALKNIFQNFLRVEINSPSFYNNKATQIIYFNFFFAINHLLKLDKNL